MYIRRPKPRARHRPARAKSSRGLTIGCRGCGAGHVFGRTPGLRAGPAPLTLVSLGRWAGIAAAAGDILLRLPCVYRRSGSGGEPPHHVARAFPSRVRHTSSWFG